MRFGFSIYLFLLLFAWRGFAAGFTGQLKSTTDDYPYHVGPPTQDIVPYLSLEFSDKHKLTKSLRFQWKLFALTNTASRSPPENFYGDIPEGFFEYKAGFNKFRLGMNTLNWGVVDVSSPSDVINTLAIFQPLRSFKQGAATAEVILGSEALNFDLLYIPVQRPPQLPSKDSRWLPRQFLLNVPGQGTLILPPGMQYEYLKPQTYDHALNNNYGAKIASHVGSWDFQLTHFDGSAPYPKLQPPTINLIPGNTPTQAIVESPISLSPVYYRQRTTGFGFVWAGEKLILRGETAYEASVTQNVLVQPWSWTSVLGAETSVDVGTTAITVLAQYYYSKNPQSPDDFISSTYRLFDNTAILGARWAYSEALTLTASALYEGVTQGWFWTAGFDQKWTDHIRWGLGWRNFSAGKDGLLKTLEKNSHATMDLTYFF